MERARLLGKIEVRDDMNGQFIHWHTMNEQDRTATSNTGRQADPSISLRLPIPSPLSSPSLLSPLSLPQDIALVHGRDLARIAILDLERRASASAWELGIVLGGGNGRMGEWKGVGGEELTS